MNAGNRDSRSRLLAARVTAVTGAAVRKRRRIGLAVLVVAVVTGTLTVGIASAHKSMARTTIRLVPVTDPNYPNHYEIHVKSRRAMCFRRVPVAVYRDDGTLLWANETNRNGVAISPHDDKPRQFDGAAYAGARAVVDRRVRRTAGHRHGCRRASAVFPAANSRGGSL